MIDLDAIDRDAYERGKKDALESCSQIALSCARGAAIEVNGEQHLLGSMANNPEQSQYATAMAIFEAIEALATQERGDTP